MHTHNSHIYAYIYRIENHQQWNGYCIVRCTAWPGLACIHMLRMDTIPDHQKPFPPMNWIKNKTQWHNERHEKEEEERNRYQESWALWYPIALHSSLKFKTNNKTQEEWKMCDITSWRDISLLLSNRFKKNIVSARQIISFYFILFSFSLIFLLRSEMFIKVKMWWI